MNSKQETCPTHGVFESKKIVFFDREIWSKCGKCSEEKRIADEQKHEEEKRLQAARRWMAQLSDACIPERFIDREITTFNADSEGKKRALDFATRYANDFTENRKTGRCAIFCGKPGTGKTHLSVGVAKEVMKQHYTALFITVFRAIRQVKDSWNKSSNRTEQEVINSLVYPDLLVLDEVGIQFGSETEKLILFDVLNERYEKRKPTLLLSNLEVKEMKAYLGERIFDRLREDHGAVVSFDWESYRTNAE